MRLPYLVESLRIWSLDHLVKLLLQLFTCVWRHSSGLNVRLRKVMKILLHRGWLILLLRCRVVKLICIGSNFVGLRNRADIWLLSLVFLNQLHHLLHVFHHGLLFQNLTLLFLLIFIISHTNKLFNEHLKYVIAILKFKSSYLLQVINLNNVGVYSCCKLLLLKLIQLFSLFNQNILLSWNLLVFWLNLLLKSFCLNLNCFLYDF